MTRQRALDTLRGLLGDEEAEVTWARTCEALGLRGDGPLGFTELERVADELMSREGAVSLVGSSLSIRVRTYRMLDGAERLGAFLENEDE